MRGEQRITAFRRRLQRLIDEQCDGQYSRLDPQGGHPGLVHGTHHAHGEAPARWRPAAPDGGDPRGHGPGSRGRARGRSPHRRSSAAGSSRGTASARRTPRERPAPLSPSVSLRVPRWLSADGAHPARGDRTLAGGSPARDARPVHPPPVDRDRGWPRPGVCRVADRDPAGDRLGCQKARLGAAGVATYCRSMSTGASGAGRWVPSLCPPGGGGAAGRRWGIRNPRHGRGGHRAALMGPAVERQWTREDESLVGSGTPRIIARGGGTPGSPPLAAAIRLVHCPHSGDPIRYRRSAVMDTAPALQILGRPTWRSTRAKFCPPGPKRWALNQCPRSPLARSGGHGRPPERLMLYEEWRERIPLCATP
jgi:hypothetical protein